MNSRITRRKKGRLSNTYREKVRKTLVIFVVLIVGWFAVVLFFSSVQLQEKLKTSASSASGSHGNETYILREP